MMVVVQLLKWLVNFTKDDNMFVFNRKSPHVFYLIIYYTILDNGHCGQCTQSISQWLLTLSHRLKISSFMVHMLSTWPYAVRNETTHSSLRDST